MSFRSGLQDSVNVVQPPPQPPDLSGNSRLTLDYQIGAYIRNVKIQRYYHTAGVLHGSVAAADGASAEVIKQHAAYGGKAVFFSVARAGFIPLLPGLETGDPNIVYLRGEVVATSPAIQMDGVTYLYAVEGYYLYGFLKPVWVNTATGLPLGSLMIDRTSPEQNVLPAAIFIDPGKKFALAPGDTPGTLASIKGSPVPASAVKPTVLASQFLSAR